MTTSVTISVTLNAGINTMGRHHEAIAAAPLQSPDGKPASAYRADSERYNMS